MKKHMAKLLATLLAAIMLLPATVQAAPADGWTDEAEQAYQTVTQLVIQRVTESKDYLAAATQEENAKNVYALWTSGADVPDGFYDDYLRALANWMDIAAKRGKAGYDWMWPTLPVMTFWPPCRGRNWWTRTRTGWIC